MLDSIAPPVSIVSLLPELIIVTAGCVALLLGQAKGRASLAAIPWVGLVGMVAAGLIIKFNPPTVSVGAGAVEILGGLSFDYLADFVRLSALILGIVLLLTAWSEPSDSESGEFFSMFLFALAGLMLVGSASNFLVLFLAIELVSVPTYVMIALSRRSPKAIEACTKYFYLGALAAAITAYGFSLLFGVAGSARFDADAMYRISEALATPGTSAYAIATVGIVLSIGGLLFKIAAVPLHFYVADVYEGAASPVSGFLGFVPKFAGMIAIMKLVALTGWQTTSGGLFWMLWLVAACSMTFGNVLALRQTNVKRMLAFSGVAHAGYMLVGIMAGPATISIVGDGTAAVLYYIVVYGIANLGAFALLGLLRVRGQACETLTDLAGLVRRYPGLALLMALSMLALMGLPPTTGFWGKVSLFGSGLTLAANAVPDKQPWIIALVIIAAVNSAIGAAYYLRVTAVVLLYEAEETADPAPREAQYMGAVLCGFLTLLFTFFPSLLMNAGSNATVHLRAAYDDRPHPSELESAAAADEAPPTIAHFADQPEVSP